jgi:hypothetical protein
MTEVGLNYFCIEQVSIADETKHSKMLIRTGLTGFDSKDL